MNAISTFSRLHLAATLVIGLSLFSTGGHATPVVDQHNLGPIQGNVAYDHNLSRGQSFTVGIEGLLAGVEFHFNKSRSRATGNAYVSMYSTDGGGAPDNLLGQVSLPAASISTTHALVYFDLTPPGHRRYRRRIDVRHVTCRFFRGDVCHAKHLRRRQRMGMRAQLWNRLLDGRR